MKQAHPLKVSGWKSSQQKKTKSRLGWRIFFADTVVDLEDFYFAEFSAKCQEVLRIPRSFYLFLRHRSDIELLLRLFSFWTKFGVFYIFLSVFNMWENRARTRLRQTEKSIANLRLQRKKTFDFFSLCPWTQSDLLFKVTVHNLRLVFL